MSSMDAINASFVMGFIVLVTSCWETPSQYGKGRNTSITRLRYSANHNALDSWPIRAHLTSQNDELCKNQRVSERRGNNNVQYVKKKKNWTTNHKHSALHKNNVISHMTPLKQILSSVHLSSFSGALQVAFLKCLGDTVLLDLVSLVL